MRRLVGHALPMAGTRLLARKEGRALKAKRMRSHTSQLSSGPTGAARRCSKGLRMHSSRMAGAPSLRQCRINDACGLGCSAISVGSTRGCYLRARHLRSDPLSTQPGVRDANMAASESRKAAREFAISSRIGCCMANRMPVACRTIPPKANPIVEARADNAHGAAVGTACAGEPRSDARKADSRTPSSDGGSAY